MGAVNHVVGYEGTTYTSPEGKDYQLTGWTVEAIARQEQYLEQRSFSALKRMEQVNEKDRAAAYAILAHDYGAKMSCSYGTDTWDRSLAMFPGIAHYFSVLSGCSLSEATRLMHIDSENVQEAVFRANPHFRATAEKLKDKEGEAQ